ncbi:MAG: hypothetical protein BGO09_13180 [Bacteroidetes bacterium 47-18]|nr:MAG: hypothetical protein BGO09_13180 [Bacteroidetes bacterium 47-18]
MSGMTNTLSTFIVKAVSDPQKRHPLAKRACNKRFLPMGKAYFILIDYLYIGNKVIISYRLL